MSDDITIYKGSTKKFQFSISDENGNLLDLSGDTVTLRVAKTISSPELLSKSRTDGTSNGGVTFDITVSDSSLSPGLYKYELFLQRSTGEEYVAERGDLSVLRGLGDSGTEYLFNDVEEVRETNPYLFDTVTDKELTLLLEGANQRIRRDIGTVMDTVRIVSDTEYGLLLEYGLQTQRIVEIEEVRVGNLVVSDTEYSVSNDSIVFLNSFAQRYEGNQVTISFIPEEFKTMERLQAIISGYRRGIVVSEQNQNRVSDFEDVLRKVKSNLPRATFQTSNVYY